MTGVVEMLKYTEIYKPELAGRWRREVNLEWPSAVIACKTLNHSSASVTFFFACISLGEGA
jgi:hypothetical protein